MSGGRAHYAPAEVAPLYVGQPQFLQACAVSVRGPQVGGGRDVVQDEAADDQVKSAAGERQPRYVAGMQVDPGAHAFTLGVAPGGIRAVAGLVGAPQVDADRTPAGRRKFIFWWSAGR